MTTYDKGSTFRLDQNSAALTTALASPPAIGGTTPSSGTFTSVSAASVTANSAALAYADLTSSDIDLLTLKAGGSTEYIIGNSTNAFNLDCSNGNVQSLTMTDNVPISGFVVSNPKDGQTVNLFIKQGAGAYTLGWPTNFKWPGGVAGTISTTNNATDLLVLTYRAATAFWYCTLLKAFA